MLSSDEMTQASTSAAPGVVGDIPAASPEVHPDLMGDIFVPRAPRSFAAKNQRRATVRRLGVGLTLSLLCLAAREHCG